MVILNLTGGRRSIWDITVAAFSIGQWQTQYLSHSHGHLKLKHWQAQHCRKCSWNVNLQNDKRYVWEVLAEIRHWAVEGAVNGRQLWPSRAWGVTGVVFQKTYRHLKFDWRQAQYIRKIEKNVQFGTWAAKRAIFKTCLWKFAVAEWQAH